MKLAAANAIANLIPENELNDENIIVPPFHPTVAQVVCEAVKNNIEK